MPKMRDDSRAGSYVSSASSFSPVPINLMGTPVTERIDVPVEADLSIKPPELVKRAFDKAEKGGYGIMTSPTMGRVAAALASGGKIPAEIDVAAEALSPARSFA